MAQKSQDLTEGPVWRALLTVSGPMMFGILGVVSVGLIDSFYLSRVGGDALAAIGFIFPVQLTISSLSIGLSAGANAVISQALGRRDDGDAVTRRGLHALLIGFVFAALTALLFWLADGWILSLMGARDGVLDAALQYTPIWAASFPFLVLMMLINAIFRAHGNGTWAATIMVFSAVVNVAATPVFIFGFGPVPELGIAGAALGTSVAQIAAFCLAAAMAWRSGILRPCGSLTDNFASNLASIAKVGGPASLSNAVNPGGMALVTAAVATVGSAYVGGFGAATRVESLVTVPMLALSAGIGPVVGQNWGAEKPKRVQQALRLTFAFCIGYGLLVAIGLTLFADQIAALFEADETTSDATASYLRIVGWSFFAYGMLVTGNAALNGISRAGHSMTISIARVFAVYVPLAWAGVMIFGYVGILGAALIANAFGAYAVLVAARATGLMAMDIPGVRLPARHVPE